MIAPETLAAIRSLLRPKVSGYFPNTVHEERATCLLCRTPVDGYLRCRPCSRYVGQLFADRVAPLAYAWPSHQSGYVMYGYKSPTRPIGEAKTAVALMLAAALALHTTCVEALAGQSVAHWVTVPSLPAKPGEHPLHSIMRSIPAAPGQEVSVSAASQVADPRTVNTGHFSIRGSVIPSSHVLLVDDTWTSGSHVQSLAGALKSSGAGIVSVLTVARWLKPTFGPTVPFMKRISKPDYDPAVCPWTSGQCPA